MMVLYGFLFLHTPTRLTLTTRHDANDKTLRFPMNMMKRSFNSYKLAMEQALLNLELLLMDHPIMRQLSL